MAIPGNLRMHRQAGFTLVEMATVLIIIGLLLGMAFKGRDLIDGARVKSLYANTSKIQTAMQVYYERYQSWPGDGCTSETAKPGECAGDIGNPKDGLISSAAEAGAFWNQLVNQTGMLAAKDQQLPTGGKWVVAAGQKGVGGTDADTTWLVAGALGSDAVDGRYVCALDQQFDDGDPTTGHIRSDATYKTGDDCWTARPAASLAVRILP
ncbi:type II secretion system protein [Silvimonas amylolytica]|nr:prepilin-type N-terminal cleavage/methylation domain-containing protein [Silvimonas amylolytica]